MDKIIIDDEFKHLMPTLDKKTFEALEENILENGCRDALVLWGDVLIDGHNRYSICTKHNLPFKTVNKDFASREDVLLWIISTQVSRRNLTPMQLTHFRGLHYRMEKKAAGNPHIKRLNDNESAQNDHFNQTQKTATILAEKYRVAPVTIRRDAKASEAIDLLGEISSEAKSKILSGEVRIEKKVLEGLADASKVDLEQITRKITDGTYARENRKTNTGSDVISMYTPSRIMSKLPSTSEEMRAFVLNITTGNSYQELLNATESCDSKMLKTALTAYISTLMDLYKLL